MVMTRDVAEVADEGYMKLLEVTRIAGKLLLTLIFILAENHVAVILLIVYPVIRGI